MKVFKPPKDHGEAKPVAIEIIYAPQPVMAANIREHYLFQESRLRLDFPLNEQMEDYIKEVIEEFGG